MPRRRAAFTLVELLVTVAIIAALAILVTAVAPGMMLRGQIAASLSNMRQIGTAFQAYANDNDFNLPGRVTSADRWPRLLLPYMPGGERTYADPGDPNNYVRRQQDPLSNGSNHTSYLMNGYNDLGAYGDETVVVKLTSVERPSQTILLGNQSGSGNFYMDTVEGNQSSGVLRKNVFNDGANYLFTDGSARFLKESEYDDALWLVHKPAPGA